mmetsp:Transcript_12074/g.19136  ORF Transcript_12074/g.19136 Transcript_12074/m.19136 type:complete len:92 (-) Transcript_12074:82-357(-)
MTGHAEKSKVRDFDVFVGVGWNKVGSIWKMANATCLRATTLLIQLNGADKVETKKGGKCSCFRNSRSSSVLRYGVSISIQYISFIVKYDGE